MVIGATRFVLMST